MQRNIDSVSKVVSLDTAVKELVAAYSNNTNHYGMTMLETEPKERYCHQKIVQLLATLNNKNTLSERELLNIDYALQILRRDIGGTCNTDRWYPDAALIEQVYSNAANAQDVAEVLMWLGMHKISDAETTKLGVAHAEKLKKHLVNINLNLVAEKDLALTKKIFFAVCESFSAENKAQEVEAKEDKISEPTAFNVQTKDLKRAYEIFDKLPFHKSYCRPLQLQALIAALSEDSVSVNLDKKQCYEFVTILNFSSVPLSAGFFSAPVGRFAMRPSSPEEDALRAEAASLREQYFGKVLTEAFKKIHKLTKQDHQETYITTLLRIDPNAANKVIKALDSYTYLYDNDKFPDDDLDVIVLHANKPGEQLSNLASALSWLDEAGISTANNREKLSALMANRDFEKVYQVHPNKKKNKETFQIILDVSSAHISAEKKLEMHDPSFFSHKRRMSEEKEAIHESKKLQKDGEGERQTIKL
jgi:hypothetical protein